MLGKKVTFRVTATPGRLLAQRLLAMHAFIHFGVSTAGGHLHVEVYATLPTLSLPAPFRPPNAVCTLQLSMHPTHFERLVNGTYRQDESHLLEIWNGELNVPRSCEQTQKLRGSTLAGPKTGRKRLALQAAPAVCSSNGQTLSLRFDAGRLDLNLSTGTTVDSTRPSVLPQPTLCFRGCGLHLELNYEQAIFKGGRTLEEAMRHALLGCVVAPPSLQPTLHAFFS